MADRDWRYSAYLSKENWPEAIPWTGPKREYGPYPWGEISHHNPHDVDTYNWSHPDAASVGGPYMGDVCPMCGVPVPCDEEVVNIRGSDGKLFEVSPNENPVPVYHPECWKDRQATIHGRENATLGDFA